MAGRAPSAPAQRQGSQCACVIAIELPNSGLRRLRIVPPTSCSLPRERKVRRVYVKGAPAVRGALCWAEGECQPLGTKSSADRAGSGAWPWGLMK